MILADFGTSYCKIFEPEKETEPRIVPTRSLPRDFKADLATGHNAARRSFKSINELTALARGGRSIIEEEDFVLLDCGSRDIKFVRFADGEVVDMGWNAECGASMGFTIELLATYYQIDYKSLPVPSTGFSITCGVLGMSHIFDAVVSGASEAEAVAKFVRGIALNAYRFAKEPERLYLSGGLCDNPLFVRSFPCDVIPLGRFILLEGLLSTLKET
ncbi:ATPase [Desulfobulbus rhabdoformis]|uniref:ATPase n=1 Tax=Desulfobulbus rhabdoformis TaxID=34032 RepID=UPI00196530CF|nr:ATPase [Desulfobulbus rhabdoformis]MBM9614733.1 ATPase [Desulfobulbus rhabdoformis]